MTVTHNQIIAVLMIVASLAVGFVVREDARRQAEKARVENIKRDRATNAAQIEGCNRNSARVVISAAGWDDVHKALVVTPKPLREEIKAVSMATKRYVPLPKGIKISDPRPYQVDHVVHSDGTSEIVPTATALRIMDAGCRQVYPAP